MCFTPTVSLSTAIIEWAIAAFILLKYNKSVFSRFVFIFLFILGFYQFTEYMLCTTGNVELWGKVGFITYTLLPAIGLHFTLSYTKNKFNKILVYLPIAVVILIVIANNNFITSGSCSNLFVSVESYFYGFNNPVGTILYFIMYASYIGIVAGYLVKSIRKTSNKTLILIYAAVLVTALLTIVPPLVLFVIFPSFTLGFPSVYCQFGFLFSILALFVTYLDDKLKHKFKHILKDIAHKIKL